MNLRRNQYCPIHRSLSCCGREVILKKRFKQMGVQRIEDPHHPRGFRELRSNAEMRKLLNRKIVEQNRTCAICKEAFTNYNDIVPDHINPRGMKGAWRDDHPDNIQAVHWWCNGEGIHQSLKKIAVNLNTLPQRRAAASACSSGCLKSFCVRPEFGNGHSEVTADRGHDIASGIGYAALDESKIIAAVSKRIGHGYLGNSALYTHFRDGASEYLTRRFGPAFFIRPNRFAHPLMVVVACKE